MHLGLRLLFSAVLPIAAAGCGTSVSVPDTHYPPYNHPVFLTKDLPPEGAQVEVIGRIELRRGWYASMDPLLDELVDRARQVGADGVVQLRTGRTVTPFAWAVPYAEGLAVRSQGFDYRSSGMVGQWR